MLNEIINWLKVKAMGLDEYDVHGMSVVRKAVKKHDRLLFGVFKLKTDEDLKQIEEAILGMNMVMVVNMIDLEREDASQALKWTHKMKNLCHDSKSNIGRLQHGIIVITPGKVELYRGSQRV